MKIAGGLVALTALRLLIAAILPLSPDESYYWLWSRALAPGYVDHPPMVALWIRLGTWIAGETTLGVRLLGPLAAALGTWMLADAAERLFPGRRLGVPAGLLWNATLLIGAGSVIMTPDAPLLLFWTATLWAMARIVAGGGGGWWLASGAFAGAALASKYTAALLWLGIAGWVLSCGRHWLRRPVPWLAALAGAIVFAPVLIWNAQHGWVSFLKQGGRVADWTPSRAVGFLAELGGGQVGLATPLVFMLCVAGLVGAVRAFSLSRPAVVLLLAFSLPPLLVFIQHAIGDRVQGNWPAIIYPAAILAAVGLAAPSWQRWLRPAVWLGFGMTGIVLLHAVTGILPLPPQSDPVARRLEGWAALVRDVDMIRQRENAIFVVAEEYALIGELAWNAPHGMTVLGLEARLEYMDLSRVDMTGGKGLLVRAEHRGEEIDPVTWSDAVPLGFVDRLAARGVTERFRVWLVRGQVPAIALPGGTNFPR